MSTWQSPLGLRWRSALLCLPVLCLSLVACSNIQPRSGESSDAVERTKPNIIILYADDLGYGDVSSYGATEIVTPNIDALANAGIKFTDAHATSAVCTPSRYSLLTGEYGFRSRATILKGDAPSLIQAGKHTLPSMLQRAGYTTAIVGKWHLGLGDGYLDWNAKIAPGPLEIGFDYSFILPATGDRVPTVYVENHQVVKLTESDPINVSYRENLGDEPSGTSDPELLRYPADRQHSGTIVNGISRIGYQSGGKSAHWVDEDFADVFTEKALSFIRANQEKPFFLLHSFHDIHVPRLPHKRFRGASSLGRRGDAIIQLDWMVGKVLEELRTLELENDTMIIFTSDNGPVLNDGYDDGADQLIVEHSPSGVLRGGKYSTFEAGARVPFVLVWPGAVPNNVSNAVVSQVDLYASLAFLLGVDLVDNEAVDSENLLPALTGKSQEGRDILFKEGFTSMSLRQGDWKYIPASRQSDQKPKFIWNDKNIESGWSLKPQLYNLRDDLQETTNLATKHPEKLSELSELLGRIRYSESTRLSSAQ